jgi:hypothetical protein
VSGLVTCSKMIKLEHGERGSLWGPDRDVRPQVAAISTDRWNKREVRNILQSRSRQNGELLALGVPENDLAP